MLCRGIRKGISKRIEGCEVKVMKLQKWGAGSYKYGKWSIEKIDGAWLVRSSQFYPEHTTWDNTLKGAVQWINQIEGWKSNES